MKQGVHEPLNQVVTEERRAICLDLSAATEWRLNSFHITRRCAIKPSAQICLPVLKTDTGKFLFHKLISVLGSMIQSTSELNDPQWHPDSGMRICLTSWWIFVFSFPWLDYQINDADSRVNMQKQLLLFCLRYDFLHHLAHFKTKCPPVNWQVTHHEQWNDGV